ncbi:MAG: NDP-sugar synthase [Candidatus Brockarchaeota archaeon]|nr:NDP-sugar synthase [Candidatus Brockarchaeota archaeon]
MSLDASVLKVVLPVGGEAKRLQPLTALVSKACVRLLNRPIVEFSMESLAKQGVKTFIFGVKGYLNYKSLYDYFKEGIGFSARHNISPRVHIKYQPNVIDVGNADSVRINFEYLMIVNWIFGVQGDNIFDIRLREMIEFHKSKNALMTIALASVEKPEEYGIVSLDNDQRIKSFVEKPKEFKHEGSKLINAGLYLMSPEIKEVFEKDEVKKMIYENKRLDFGMDLIPYLVERDYPVYGYFLDATWFDIGTPQRYLDAMVKILYGKLKTIDEFEVRIDNNKPIYVQGQSDESIAKREEIKALYKKGKITINGAALIGRHVLIEENISITDSNIDNFSIIRKGSIVEHSAILDRNLLEEGTLVSNSVVGRHCYIKSSFSNPTKIHNLSVIGDNVTIGEGCEIVASKIWPNLSIPRGIKVINRVLKTQEEVDALVKENA